MTTPADIAKCDQELAEIVERLNLLVAVWRKVQPDYDRAGLDRIDRICAFMRQDITPGLNPNRLAAALAVAIERLAR